MDEPEPVDHKEISGLGPETEPLVTIFGLTGQPCRKKLPVIVLLPISKVTDEDKATAVNLQDMKDLGFMRDVLLKAKAFPCILEKKRVAQWA